MVPFDIQIVSTLQKDIARLVRDAQKNRPSQLSDKDKLVGQFGGGGNQQSTQTDAEATRKRAKASVESCVSIAKRVPIANTVFNWTRSKDFQRQNIGQTVVETLENDVSEDQFRRVQEALESELERYQPLTCPRRPLIKRITECFREYGDAVYGQGAGRVSIRLSEAAESGSGTTGAAKNSKSVFGGSSGSGSGDIGSGGTFGGSSAASPDKAASDCLKIVNQIGGINFQHTKVYAFLGKNISAEVAKLLASAWTGGPKPSAAMVKALRDAVMSEAENIPNGAMGSLLASLASCLEQYEKGL